MQRGAPKAGVLATEFDCRRAVSHRRLRTVQAPALSAASASPSIQRRHAPIPSEHIPSIETNARHDASGKIRLYPLSDESFDFPGRGRSEYFYFVASTECSGSTLLCTKPWQTGILGAPVEYFNFNNIMLQMTTRPGARSLDEYLRRLFEVRTSPNGVFGAKIHWPHLQFLLLSKLLGRFPKARRIFTDRRDVVAQAVSYAKAVQTQQWRSSAEPQADPKYDFGTILRLHQALLADKNGWQRFFENAKIRPFKVFYEDFIERPDVIVAEIVRELDFPTGPGGAVTVPEVARQGDETNVAWAERFMQEAAQQKVAV